MSMLKILTVLLVLGFAFTAFAPVPSNAETTRSSNRNVLFELFTATWCKGCPYADGAADELKVDYGERLSVLQYHIGEDGLDTAATNSRAEDYGVISAEGGEVPALWVDRTDSRVGASSKADALDGYKTMLDQRLSSASALSISIAGTSHTSSNISVTASLTDEGLAQETFELRFVAYENDIKLTPEEIAALPNEVVEPDATYNYVVRDIVSLSVSKSSLPATITKDLALESDWVFDNMGAVVFAQTPGQGEIIQSASRPFGAVDSDGDGLDDEWENAKLNTLMFSGTDDPDGDGCTNLQEYQAHTDPLASDAPQKTNYAMLIVGGFIAVSIILASISMVNFRGLRKPKEIISRDEAPKEMGQESTEADKTMPDETMPDEKAPQGLGPREVGPEEAKPEMVSESPGPGETAREAPQPQETKSERIPEPPKEEPPI